MICTLSYDLLIEYILTLCCKPPFESDSEATSESSNHNTLLPGAEATQIRLLSYPLPTSLLVKIDSLRVAWRALALTLFPLLIPLPPTPSLLFTLKGFILEC